LAVVTILLRFHPITHSYSLQLMMLKVQSLS